MAVTSALKRRAKFKGTTWRNVVHARRKVDLRRVDPLALWAPLFRTVAAVTSALVDSTLRTSNNGTTATVTGVQFGTAFAGRVIVISWSTSAYNERIPTAITIGGVSATIMSTTGAGGYPGFGIAYAVVPTGTSGSVVFTFSVADTVDIFSAVALTGAASATASDTISNSTGASGNIDVGAGGCIVAFGGDGTTWTGVTALATDTTYFNLSTAKFDNSGGALTNRAVSYSGGGFLLAAAFDASGGGGSFSVAANGGTYSITGAAVTTKRGRVVAASGGSYAISGSAVTLRKNKPVAIAGGSYAITGTAVTLRHAWLLTASGGTYSVTGADVTLTKSANKTVAANAGSYAITGSAVSLLHGWKVAASGGSYAISGSAVTLKHAYAVSVQAGSYAINGAAVSLSHAWKISASGGSYSITGANVTLTKASDKRIAADAGSYSITGASVAMSRTYAVAVDGGTYNIIGSDVNFIAGVRAGVWVPVTSQAETWTRKNSASSTWTEVTKTDETWTRIN